MAAFGEKSLTQSVVVFSREHLARYTTECRVVSSAVRQNNMVFTIRRAIPEEAAALSIIAVQAKAHWGYAKEQLDLWAREFLQVSPNYITGHHVWVACMNAVPVGFAGVGIHEAEAELDHLWILPPYIGQGVGRQLFLYSTKRMNELGYPELIFTSDPHADGFYRKLGAESIGEYYSVLQNTRLTKFKFTARTMPSGESLV